MAAVPPLHDEAGRLAALHRYAIVDTPPEQEFDDLARLAAAICGVPIAQINFVDADHLWVKAQVGLPLTQVPRIDAICNATIQHPNLLIVPDLQGDRRFAGLPAVTGEERLRFYAGAPLLTAEGDALGAICVLDRAPRHLTADQYEALRVLARQVITQLERRRAIARLGEAIAERDAAEAAMHAEEARRRGAALLSALTERSSDLISVLDPQGIYLYASPSHLGVLGTPADTLIGRNALDGLHPDDAPSTEAALRRVVREGGTLPVLRARVRHADGTWRWLEIVGTNALADPSIGGIIVNSRDITERIQAEEELRASDLRFRSVAESTPDAIIVLNRQGDIVSWNRGATALFGYAPEEALGQPMTMMMPERYRAAHTQGLARLNATRQPHILGQVVELVGQHRDGTAFPLELSLGTWSTAEGPYYCGIIRDITARKRSEEHLHHQALHDPLTDLPNRVLLRDRVEHALHAARRDHGPVALLLLDLDRFKEVNDTFGHLVGDTLLRQVGARLQGALRAADTVSRLGGDEFAMLLPGAGHDGALAAAHKVQAALDIPTLVGEQALHVEGSLGIALAANGAGDFETLLRQADVAMYAAKGSKVPYAVYTPDNDTNTPERLSLISDLHAALNDGELLLHYQPKIDLAAGRVAGVEALVRWGHPRRGLVLPGQFIPLAEHTGLIGPLTLWVLEEALRQCHAWTRQGHALGVAVNLSTRTLQDPHLPETLAGLLRRYAVSPGLLTLEITESALMADPARAQAILTRLGDLGVRAAIDDFGTGYSSLAYLKQLAVDEVKIDQSFIRGMGATGLKDTAIVRSVIDLGHNLGLKVVAEGVETQAVWEHLRAARCDVAQGYYVSRPLPVADLERWLAASWPGAAAGSLGVSGGPQGLRDAGDALRR